MHEEDLYRSAFLANCELFKNTLLAFRYSAMEGDRHSPSSYASIILKTLSGIPNVQVHIDDTALLSTDLDEAIEKLREVLRRLNKLGVLISIKKISLWKMDYEYLGWHINQEGKH